MEVHVDNMPVNGAGFEFLVSVLHDDDGTVSVISCNATELSYLGVPSLSNLPDRTVIDAVDDDGCRHRIGVIHRFAAA